MARLARLERATYGLEDWITKGGKSLINRKMGSTACRLSFWFKLADGECPAHIGASA
jgi:hypothetical protein